MGEAVTYASAVRAVVGAAADPLVDAAVALEAAADAVAFAQAMARWRNARRAVEAGLASYVAGPLADIALLRDELIAHFEDAAGLRLDLPFGPLRVNVDASAAGASTPAGGREVLGPNRPNVFRATLDAGMVSGAGVLALLPDGFHGGFGIDLGVVSATALASLRRTPGGAPSFLAVIGVQFRPPVQLSFGFSLDRVGGLVAVNRRADVTALATLLRGGTAADALFPSDPVRDAPRILATLDRLFPPAEGSAVVGPTLRLSWLSIGGLAFFSLDLGVFIELPGPRIIVVGVARAGIQGVIGIRLDILGVIDIPSRLLAIDATLVDSGVLGIFILSGDAAFRLSWGNPAYTVLSIGGFFPGFKPEPASIPPVARVAMSLARSFPGITLRAEGYFAVTPNTVQLGGKWEAGLKAGPVSATGFLSIDAMVQFTPFHFRAEVSAGFRVRVFGLTFAGVRIDGVIDGPGPLVISGRLTIETFLFDVSWSESFTLGSGNAPPAGPVPVLADVVASQAVPVNLSAAGHDPVVQLSPELSGDASVLVPLGALTWHQKRTPLGVAVTRVEGAPLGRTGKVTVTSGEAVSPPVLQPVPEQFAPGQLSDFAAGQALNAPPFEDLPAGLRLQWPANDDGARHDGTDTYKTFRKLPAGIASVHPGLALANLRSSVLRMVLTSREAEVSDHDPAVTVSPPKWATTKGSLHDTSYEARMAARLAGGGVIPATDLAAPLAMSAVL